MSERSPLIFDEDYSINLTWRGVNAIMTVLTLPTVPGRRGLLPKAAEPFDRMDVPESAAPIGNPDRRNAATPAEARRDHGHKRGRHLRERVDL